MPLPQKVIEQLGREPPKTPGWSGQLLMFSTTVFVITLLIYLGLVFGYKPYLNAEVNSLQKQIQQFSQQIPLEEQNQIISFYSQLLNLRSLLTNHVISSPVFTWLEDNTQINVYFASFSLNRREGQVRLAGVAKTMEDVTQQFAIFVSKPEIAKVEIPNVSFSSGAWRFDVTLTFIPGYFLPGGLAAQSQ